MRIRHLLLSSVVFGGIAVMSASSFAQTAPAVVYKPQGEWAVTRVAAKGPGKDPYCTMARRFGDNTILTFAAIARAKHHWRWTFSRISWPRGKAMT